MPRSSKRGSSSRGGRGGRGRGSHRGRGLGGFSAERESISVALSLVDEARHTSQHNHWDQSSTLRQKPVSFVSAGQSEPLKQLEDDIIRHDEIHTSKELADDPMPPFDDRNDEPEEPRTDDQNHNSIEDPAEADTVKQGGKDNSNVEPNDLFFFDLKGESAKTRDVAKTPIEIPDRDEECSSSSDDEVILFRGRDTPARAFATSQLATGITAADSSTITVSQMKTEIAVVEEEINQRPGALNHSTAGRGPQFPDHKNNHKNNHKRHARKNSEDAFIADYIANMRENGEMPDLIHRDHRNTRDIGGPLDASDEDIEETLNTLLNEASTGIAKESNIEPEENADLSGSASELDDETLARLIAGQDLNFGSAARSGARDSSSNSSSSEGLGRFNQIDDYDVMDWERPSLQRRKGKGARAKLKFDVSDSDMEQRLQAAWDGDRLKKAQRKKQREELRALGMLGKKASNSEDLRVKYPNGMTIQQVAEEMKDFLLADDQSLSLPPMDTHARKMVHELANKFNVKSKSMGKADQRRPTLHRTKRTLAFSETSFNQAVAKINRRYFPRLDTKGKRGNRAPPITASGTAASYREGEVVGAAAPELGSDNRGRAMLEKMGWSSGTALGTLDNKGILQPVPQTMKKSRAGLG